MEEEMECPTCSQLYCPDRIVPKLLVCGHTLCKSCLENINKTTRACPKCALLDIITGTQVDTPEDNYALRLVESLWASKEGMKIIHSSLRKNFAKTAVVLRRDSRDGSTNLKLLFNYLMILDELTNNWEETSATRIELILKPLQANLRTINDSIGTPKPKTPNIDLAFNDSDGRRYLLNIYMAVINGQTVIAVKEENKYSRISVRGDKLMLHSLQYIAYKDPGCRIVNYDELMKCLQESLGFSVFLDIRNETGTDDQIMTRLIIKPEKNTIGNNFTKVCSGEGATTGFKNTVVKFPHELNTSNDSMFLKCTFRFDCTEIMNQDCDNFEHEINGLDSLKEYIVLNGNQLALASFKQDGKTCCSIIGKVSSSSEEKLSNVKYRDAVEDCGVTVATEYF